MLYVLHVYNFVPNERRMINFQGILKYRFDAFSLLNLEIYKWRWYIRILLVSISICWFILYCDVALSIDLFSFRFSILVFHRFTVTIFNIDLNIFFRKVFQRDWIFSASNNDCQYIFRRNEIKIGKINIFSQSVIDNIIFIFIIIITQTIKINNTLIQ